MKALKPVCIILLWAAPAAANQPPGPQMILGEIAILPVMMLLTSLGGGYAVMRERKLGPRHRGWMALAAVLTVFFSGMHEGFGLLVLLLFGILAAGRGARLLRWSFDSGPRPPEATAARLRGAGMSLLLIGVFTVGIGPAFMGWWPADSYVENDLKRMVALQMVQARKAPPSREGPQYQPLVLDERLWTLDEHRFPFLGPLVRHYGMEFRLHPGGRSYQFWAWPRNMPVFPYNFLTSLPSFYTDQTGQLRRIRVHWDEVRCPPDAPVYYRVTPDDANAGVR